MLARPFSGLAVAVVVCVVLGSLGLVAGLTAPSRGDSALPNSHSAGTDATASASPGASSSPAGGAARVLALESAMRAKGISPNSVHFPNLAGAVTDPRQPVQPSYTQAPAPMGVADLGLENISGVLVPYELNTTSVAGTVNITNLQSLYLDGDGPDTYGIQMNSVVAGVTIFGNSSYQFWSQNYVDYTSSTQQLVFGDEVWNFSSPSGVFPTSSVYGFSPNGTFADFPFLYQGYGPAITIGYPFTLTLYLNTSTIADRPALYFNYTVSNDSFRQSSSYDYLIFNSTAGTPTSAAPVPYYQADGYNYDPIGLPNDMEIDILGNDDGDTTAFTAANATVSLDYWNSTAGEMQDVPSAYSAGQETGETAVGLFVVSSGGSNPVGIVRSGPGLVGGLWNYSTEVGVVADKVTVDPVSMYSFLFVNLGAAEDVATAQWVPTSPTGTTTFYLPAGGTYFLDFMMNEYEPATRVITATASVTLPTEHLVADAGLGIYTPIFAFTNAELAGSSSPGGAGTLADPYVLENNQYGSLSPQFAAWDDFLFPVFPGILIAGTSAYVDVTPPSLEINLPPWDVAPPYVAALGLPATNDLQIEFYDASNISLVGAPAISGWMSSFLYGYPESSVIAWNCTDTLVASNTFDDQGNALLLYGGTNNTVWGNTFVPTATGGSDSGSIDDSGYVTGVNETESGDLVYDNYFAVPLPAITPTADPFPCDQYGYCYFVTYNDTWNVSQQPASNYSIVNGFNLTGSIIGTWYEGGNYWSNYGTASDPYGILPYNDSEAITAGGDYVPLVFSTLYTVTFNETGLAAGTPWNVTVLGITTASVGATLVLEAPNGTYDYSLAAAGYLSSGGGNFTVNGTSVTVNVTFEPFEAVTFTAHGLIFGWTWSVSAYTAEGTFVAGGNTNGSSIVFDLAGGASPLAYSGTASASGYAPLDWSTHVGTAAMTVTLNFTVIQVITFEEHGLAAGTAWTVQLSQGSWSTSATSGTSTLTFSSLQLQYGSFFFTVGALNYTAAPENGTASTANPTILVQFTPVNGTLDLTVAPSAASVLVDGRAVALGSDGAATLSLAPGSYVVNVTDPGFIAYATTVSISSSHTTSLEVALTAVPTAASAPAPSISSAAWAAIGLLAALAVVFALLALAYRSRARRPPPKPMEPVAETATPPPTNPGG